jgi:hypothetical protein
MSHQLLSVTVECYAGYRSEETPLRFRLGDRSLEVNKVVDRWLAPDHRYFKVRAEGDIYILRHDITSGEWEVTVFERGASRSRQNQALSHIADLCTYHGPAEAGHYPNRVHH